MRFGMVGAIGVLAAGVLFASVADAEKRKPRDSALNPTKPGNDIYMDAILIGAQLSYENRTDLEEGMSQIKSRVSALATTPFADVSANLDLSVFLYSFGFSAGYRGEWRAHQGRCPVARPFPEANGDYPFHGGQNPCPDIPGIEGEPSNKANTRDQRTFEEARKNVDITYGSQKYPYVEGRFQFAMPLAEEWAPTRYTAPLLFLNRAFVRWEDRQTATFDWLNIVPHDGGVFFKYEGTLFYRHRDFGAIGPSIRYLNLERSEPVDDGQGGIIRRSKRVNDLHYGFTLASNPGWRAGSDDVLLLQFYLDVGNDLAGTHIYQDLFGGETPFQILLVYRTVLSL